MDMFIKFLVAAIGAGTPLLFGTVGEILNEKVGHLNLGVEGMMAIGACAGFMGGYLSDNFLVALLCAFLAGMLAALIYAVLTVTFMANQNVAGLTMTIFGVGISNFIGVYMIGTSDSGTLKLPETVTAQMRSIHIPVLSDLPVVGELVFSYNPFVYLGIVVAAVTGWYLYRTKTGLNVQAIGENPGAADAASIQVTKWKYFNILLGGGICGIGGAYCGMIINGGVWISNSVNGLGWIAVALVIFAAWKPHMAILGSFVFGALRVLKYYKVGFMVNLPDAFFDMLPFLITALVLIITSMRGSKGAHIPAFLGNNYFREER
ncbi:ABC transporter permease [Gemmiger sp. An87]|uniref:ABC transporter permease n=1 Tax=Allofournierella massiliensis TaxID=1650663 RepID=A0ABT7URK5_9FIRM|nr:MULTISPECIES: ABC transporter permease [Fournierella]MDM8201516.1 ABC transporter permease [Fournierella massiliensis]OUN13254.1 ABC transporter permease [Gemmiger sp. An87]